MGDVEPEAPFRFAVDEVKGLTKYGSNLLMVYVEDVRFPPVTYNGGMDFHIFPHTLLMLTHVRTLYTPWPFFADWHRERLIRKMKPQVLAKIDHSVTQAYENCGIPLTGPLPDGTLRT